MRLSLALLALAGCASALENDSPVAHETDAALEKAEPQKNAGDETQVTYAPPLATPGLFPSFPSLLREEKICF